MIIIVVINMGRINILINEVFRSCADCFPMSIKIYFIHFGRAGKAPVTTSRPKGKDDSSNCKWNSKQAIASDFSLTAKN